LEDPRHPYPLEQIFVVGWIGVSPSLLGPHAFGGPQHQRHLLWRTAHPEGTFSFCFLWYSLVHTIYTLVNIFSSSNFKSLCLCDLSIRCIRTAYLQSHSVFLFILGERTGSLLVIIFLQISDFRNSIFSHLFIFVISMFDIIAHRLFLNNVQCLCAS
jgi:hypothetical protein